MAFTNNVMIVRHKLLAKLVNLWKENKLTNEIDRLPIELSPRRSRPLGRCCIHKERAVYKYKLFPLLGFDMTDETDELTPLSEYARQALERKNKQKENILCVIDEACSSCVQVNYEVTPRMPSVSEKTDRQRLTTTLVSVAGSAIKAVRTTPSYSFRFLAKKPVP